MPSQIALYNGITQKMKHLALQQRVISQNISNADTPEYKAHEVSDPNFKKTMGRYMRGMSLKGATQQLPMEKTSGSHMTTKLYVGRAPMGEEDKDTYEVKPSENAVVIEEQMMKASKAATDFELVTNIYKKHKDMMSRAMASPNR